MELRVLTLEGLSDLERRRLEKIAAARQQSPEETIEALRSLSIQAIPDVSKHLPKVQRTQYDLAGMHDGAPFVVLPNGRMFFGNPSTPHHIRGYRCVSDVLPPVLTEDTYLLAIDVAQRYKQVAHPRALMPGEGGCVVEVGAYLGHKTIALVDQTVGMTGRVLAIEMMPDNVDILRRNVATNGLGHVVQVLHCGVWNAPGELEVQGHGRQRNSLVALDKLDEGELRVHVPVDSLDNILDGFDRDVIDFMPITVNGAEVEALQGLQRNLDRVKVMWVVACYTRDDGQTTYQPCLDLLRQSGCTILPQSTETAIYAVTPKYAAEFVDRI